MHPRGAQAHSSVIGWRESIDLPHWGISGLLAKSDTGALGCAIDCANIRRLKNGRICFDVVLSRRKERQVKRVTAPMGRLKRVRSSNGEVQERYTVLTQLRIGPVAKQVEFSLVSRKRMLCRVLLGRRALARDFLVDSEREFLFGRRSPLAIAARPINRRDTARLITPTEADDEPGQFEYL
ncbi:MAG: ATP-dependent zinc protease [Verrucomicrobiota bacterium]